MRRLLFLALVGCSSSSITETVVVVHAEGLAIPRDLDEVRVVVVNTQAGTPELPLCVGGATNCLTLPIVATLIPGPDHPTDVVTVQVTASLRGQPVIADAASFVFQRGQSERLDFVLYPACLGQLGCATQTQSCGADGTCTTLSLAPLGSNPSFDGGAADFAVADLAGSDLSSSPDLSSSSDLSLSSDLLVPRDLSTPDLAKPDLNSNGGFAAATCVAASAITASTSFPAGTCAAYCQNLGLTCHDDVCTTNRSISNFGVEAWSDGPSCSSYATSAGQAFCADDLTGFSSPTVAKYRCCCI